MFSNPEKGHHSTVSALNLVSKENNVLVADILLQRDCPKIYEWDGKELVGPTFVPPGFVPKYPKIIDHKDRSNLKERLEEMKRREEITQSKMDKLINEQKRGAVGDMARRRRPLWNSHGSIA